MPLGLEHSTDVKKDQQQAVDFISQKNQKESDKATVKKIIDHANKFAEKQLSNPDELKKMADMFAKGATFDDWMDQERIIQTLVNEFWADAGYKEFFQREFSSLKDEMGIKMKIKEEIEDGADWKLTKQGLKNLANEISKIPGGSDEAKDFLDNGKLDKGMTDAEIQAAGINFIKSVYGKNLDGSERLDLTDKPKNGKFFTEHELEGSVMIKNPLFKGLTVFPELLDKDGFLDIKKTKDQAKVILKNVFGKLTTFDGLMNLEVNIFDPKTGAFPETGGVVQFEGVNYDPYVFWLKYGDMIGQFEIDYNDIDLAITVGADGKPKIKNNFPDIGKLSVSSKTVSAIGNYKKLNNTTNNATKTGGLQSLATTGRLSNNPANTTIYQGVPDAEIIDRGETNFAKRVAVKTRQNIDKNGNPIMLEVGDNLHNGTDILYEANQYVDGYSPRYRWAEEASKERGNSKWEKLDPKRKLKVRKALENLFDDERGIDGKVNKELMLQHFPLALFKEQGGFFDVMRKLQTIMNDPNEDAIVKDRTDKPHLGEKITNRDIKNWVNNGFEGAKPYHMKMLGLTQNRAPKMLKILQRSNWEDLMIISATLTNVTSKEEGILDLWAAYERTGHTMEGDATNGKYSKMSDVIDNTEVDGQSYGDVFTFLCDWNLDGGLSTNLTPAQIKELYPNMTDKKAYKEHKRAMRFTGDVGPQFGQAVKFTIDQVIGYENVRLGGKLGEEKVCRHICKEILGQILSSGYLEDKMLIGEMKDTHGALLKKLTDIANNTETIDKNGLTDLIQEFPYFHSMFKSAIFTMAGGSEAEGSTPNPNNLADVLKGETVASFIEAESKVHRDLRQNINTYFEKLITANPEFKKLIEKEGETKVRNNFWTGLMQYIDGMVLRMDVGDISSVLLKDAQRMSLLQATGENLGDILLNKHKDGSIGFSLPIDFPFHKGEKKREKVNDAKGTRTEGQVFYGAERKPLKPTDLDFTIGARGTASVLLNKSMENVSLDNVGSSKYLGVKGEAKLSIGGDLAKVAVDPIDVLVPELELSAGVSYIARHLDRINKVTNAYKSAFNDSIFVGNGFDIANLANGWNGVNALDIVSKLKQSAFENLNKSNVGLCNSNKEKLTQNLEVIFAMMEKEFSYMTQAEQTALFAGKSKESKVDILLDMMYSLQSGVIAQWREGTIKNLHGALKVTGLSFEVSVKVKEAIMMVATQGGSAVTSTIGQAIDMAGSVASGQDVEILKLPVRANLELELTSFRMTHTTSVEQMVERQNRIMRMGDPEYGKDILWGVPEHEKTTQRYADAYEGLLNHPQMEVRPYSLVRNGVEKSAMQFVLDKPRSEVNIVDFLNLHVSIPVGMTAEEIYSIKEVDGKQVLTVANEELYIATLTQGKGVRRIMSIGGPIVQKELPNNDTDTKYKVIGQRVAATESFGDYDRLKGVEDAGVKEWTRDFLLNDMVTPFLTDLRSKGGQELQRIVDKLEIGLIAQLLANPSAVKPNGTYKFKYDNVAGTWSGYHINNRSDELVFEIDGNIDVIGEVVSDTTPDVVGNIMNLAVDKFSDVDIQGSLFTTKLALKNAIYAAFNRQHGTTDMRTLKTMNVVVKADGSVTFDLVPMPGNVQNIRGTIDVNVKVEKVASIDVTGGLRTDLGVLKFDRSGESTAMKNLHSYIENNNAILHNLDNVPAVRPVFGQFMESSSNIDDRLADVSDLQDMLSKREIDQAYGHLVQIIQMSEAVNPSLSAFLNQLIALQNQADGEVDRYNIVTRFKQVFAHNVNIHEGRISFADLVKQHGEKHKKLLFPNKKSFHSEGLVNTIEKYKGELLTIRGAKDAGGYVPSANQESLMGYTAFYKNIAGTYESGNKGNERFSMTAPGRTKLLSKGGVNFIKPVSDPVDNANVVNFLKANYLKDKYAMDILGQQLKKVLLSKGYTVDLDIENIKNLLNGVNTDLRAIKNGQEIYIRMNQMSLQAHVYDLWDCSNFSVGSTVENIVVTEGRATIDPVSESANGSTKERQENISVTGQKEIAAAVTKKGGWKTEYENLSAAEIAGMDEKRNSIRIGTNFYQTRNKPDTPFIPQGTDDSGNPGQGVNTVGATDTNPGSGQGVNQTGANGEGQNTTFP